MLPLFINGADWRICITVLHLKLKSSSWWNDTANHKENESTLGLLCSQITFLWCFSWDRYLQIVPVFWLIPNEPRGRGREVEGRGTQNHPSTLSSITSMLTSNTHSISCNPVLLAYIISRLLQNGLGLMEYREERSFISSAEQHWAFLVWHQTKTCPTAGHKHDWVKQPLL